MVQPAQPTPLISPPTRVSRKRLGFAVLALTLAGGALLLYKLQEQQAGVGPRRDREIPEATAEGALPSTASELRRPGSYAGLSVIPAQESPPPAAPPQPTTQVVTTQVVQTENPFADKKATTTQGQQNGQQRQVAAGRQPPNPKPANKWLFAKTAQGEQVQKPPFETKEDTDEEKGKDAKAAALFPKATWAIPDDPTRVLYRSQVINGILQHDINSDQPGPVRILVTEEVRSRFGDGSPLIPQYATLLGAQEGKVNFGQSRLDILIDSAELPDGAVISFRQFKTGDETGATGVTGAVDNHYVKLGFGALLSAALSVGSRSIAGNTQGFNPTLQQQYAADVSQDVNRTGQRIVDRFANIPPTITIAHGTPVTVMLSENVNLMSPPTRVHR
jgi:type IV secretory pathway VirB10-like protein